MVLAQIASRADPEPELFFKKLSPNPQPSQKYDRMIAISCRKIVIQSGVRDFLSENRKFQSGVREFQSGVHEFQSGVHDFLSGVHEFLSGVHAFVRPLGRLFSALKSLHRTRSRAKNTTG